MFNPIGCSSILDRSCSAFGFTSPFAYLLTLLSLAWRRIFLGWSKGSEAIFPREEDTLHTFPTGREKIWPQTNPLFQPVNTELAHRSMVQKKSHVIRLFSLYEGQNWIRSSLSFKFLHKIHIRNVLHFDVYMFPAVRRACIHLDTLELENERLGMWMVCLRGEERDSATGISLSSKSNRVGFLGVNETKQGILEFRHLHIRKRDITFVQCPSKWVLFPVFYILATIESSNFSFVWLVATLFTRWKCQRWTLSHFQGQFFLPKEECRSAFFSFLLHLLHTHRLLFYVLHASRMQL